MFKTTFSNTKKTIFALLVASAVITTGIMAKPQLVNAASKPLQMRYLEPYTSDGSASNDNEDKYVYKIGYVDKNGKSRRVTKTATHINEYISDTGKATVQDDGFGKSAEVVRPPYQTFDVNANALAAQVLMPSLVVKQTLFSVIRNEDLDSSHLSEDDIQLLISKASAQLGISHGALDYRIKSLQLFETGN